MTSGRQYASIRTDIWRDADWLQLPSDAKLLYTLLVSHPKTSTAGVVPLQLNKWIKCAPDMTLGRIEAAVGVLVDRRYILVDYETEEVLIRTYIRYNAHALGTPTVMTAALRCALVVESQRLREALECEIDRIERTWSDDHERLR
jgi:hypothetical protein